MKSAVKSLFRTWGLDVRLVRNIAAHEHRTWEQKQDALWRPFLAHRDVRTVIDVGANAGQFAGMIHRVCPAAKVFSFEPLPECRSQLESTLAGISGSKLFPMALADRTGSFPINRSAYSPCSSLLTRTEELGTEIPDAVQTETIDVPVARLDDVLTGEAIESELLVKLDVQGYEVPVIRGALATLSRAAIVVVEVCFFRKLYEGQALFDDLYRSLRELGFVFMGLAEQFPRKSDGRIVEADAIFERN